MNLDPDPRNILTAIRAAEAGQEAPKDLLDVLNDALIQMECCCDDDMPDTSAELGWAIDEIWRMRVERTRMRHEIDKLREQLRCQS